ncbi:MAG: DUF2330 domain-containing protein [Phycisphaerae bacterium]|nr:DUF2330 domain-containing protein [Phycisphaerae bacterium]
MRQRHIAAIALTILLAIPSALLADGKGFGLPTLAGSPDIPEQQAMVVFRDGNETLIVESTFETPSPQVGWVLPLPAEPTSIDKAHGGLLDTLQRNLRPRITEAMKSKWPRRAWSVTGLAAMGMLIALYATFYRNTRSAHGRVIVLAVLLFILTAFVVLILIPASVELTSADEQGIEVTAVQEIGNYTVSVLQADRADALDRWLREQDLAGLESADRQVVDRYIADGWVVCVARLRMLDGEPTTPHPLAVTFPSDRPVYPMRLTALAGGDATLLDLYVIADGTAEAAGMEVVVSDRFTPGTKAVGKATSLEIYHDQALTRMWPGCVVTRLRGRLPREAMTDDIHPTIGPFQPHRQHIYTPEAAGLLRGGIFAHTLTATFLALAVLMFKPAWLKSWGAAVPIVTLVAGSITAVAIASSLEVRRINREDIEWVSKPPFVVIEAHRIMENWIATNGPLPESLADEAQARQWLQERFADYNSRYQYDADLVLGESAGAFSMQHDGESIRLVYYGPFGSRHVIGLTPGGETVTLDVGERPRFPRD